MAGVGCVRESRFLGPRGRRLLGPENLKAGDGADRAGRWGCRLPRHAASQHQGSKELIREKIPL